MPCRERHDLWPFANSRAACCRLLRSCSVVGMGNLKVVEIDNIIPKLYQDQIEAEVSSSRMAWFFRLEPGRTVSALGPASPGADYSGFSNTVFHVEDAGAPTSPLTALLIPLLLTFCDKANLPFTRPIRIRIGLYPRIMIDVAHHPHVDFYYPHYNALYYVNDSDGDTLIFNETFDDIPQASLQSSLLEQKFTVAQRITPKRGKMIGFEGRQYHASMHPMRSSHRIAISFSFV